MSYESNQKLLAEIATQYFRRLEKAQWFYENTARGKSIKLHTHGNIDFFLNHMAGHVSFAAIDNEGSYEEFFSYYPDSKENMISWDGSYCGVIAFNDYAQVSLYDHYIMTPSTSIDSYDELNSISDDLAMKMFPFQKKFTLTEEEHFQYSLIYDLLSYEDMRMWHKVLTDDYGEVKGMVFFSVYDNELSDAVLQALVNMDGICKETLND